MGGQTHVEARSDWVRDRQTRIYSRWLGLVAQSHARGLRHVAAQHPLLLSHVVVCMGLQRTIRHYRKSMAKAIAQVTDDFVMAIQKMSPTEVAADMEEEQIAAEAYFAEFTEYIARYQSEHC